MPSFRERQAQREQSKMDAAIEPVLESARQAKAQALRLLQVELDSVTLSTAIIASARSTSVAGTSDVLSSIEDIGWRLEHVSSAFVSGKAFEGTAGSVKSASGKPVGGKIVSVYVFRNTDR